MLFQVNKKKKKKKPTIPMYAYTWHWPDFFGDDCVVVG